MEGDKDGPPDVQDSDSDESEGSNSELERASALSEGAVQEEEEAEQEAEEAEEPPDAWSYWWLTRTIRKSTCASCRSTIGQAEFRAIYHPNPLSVRDVRVWKDTFWRYYHIDRRCLPIGEGVKVLDVETLIIDCAPIPKRAAESKEQYRASVADAKKLLADEFIAAQGVAGGGAASTSSPRATSSGAAGFADPAGGSRSAGSGAARSSEGV